MSNASIRGSLRSGPFELGYSVEGEGRPTLVIGSSIYYPRTFSPALRRSLKLAFVDHRGFVPTEEVPQSEYSLDVILDDIEKVRAHLGFEQVVIVGHSGHGYMALEYAKRYPERVSHVVMIGTGPSHSAADMALAERAWEEAVCPERKAQLERDLQRLPAEIAAAPERRFITFCLRLAAKSWYDPTFDATAQWKDVRVNMPIIDHVWGEVFRDIDVTAGLERLEKPVFLALGRFDFLVAPYWAWDSRRKSFRDLTVRVFDRSSHTPQFEESDLFDAELLRWIASRPG
jgi:proline iminopeptidase